MNDIFTQIKNYIDTNSIVLFMKGTKEMPMCGFSRQVVHILNLLGADYFVVNVLENDDMREGIKLFSKWPTIPQLYVNGEFIGGCDIVNELYSSGELQKIVQAK